MQGYKCKKYTTIQDQGYMSTKLQNDVRIKTVTFQNMLHFHWLLPGAIFLLKIAVLYLLPYLSTYI